MQQWVVDKPGKIRPPVAKVVEVVVCEGARVDEPDDVVVQLLNLSGGGRHAECARVKHKGEEDGSVQEVVVGEQQVVGKHSGLLVLLVLLWA